MSLSFQFNGRFVMPPDRSNCPFWNQNFWHAEHKVMGTGRTDFASGSLEVMLRAEPFSFPLVLGPMLVYMTLSTICWMLILNVYSLSGSPALAV